MRRVGMEHGEPAAAAAVLALGVALSVGLIALGLALLLTLDGATAAPTAGGLGSLLEGALGGTARLEPAALVELGLLVLLATPLARVAVGVVAGALDRDLPHALVGFMVLALVLFGLLGGVGA